MGTNTVHHEAEGAPRRRTPTASHTDATDAHG